MRWRKPSDRVDRLLAAIEITALGTWAGALAGFAFVSAPLAFRIVAPADLSRFADLTASTIVRLTLWGDVLGMIAIVAALWRAARAVDRGPEIVRICLVAAALALAAFERSAIVPAMTAMTDLHSPAYHALHARSSAVYGAVLLAVLAALITAATRRSA